MLMIYSKVISNSPEGLKQSLDVIIYNHAQEYLVIMDIWLLRLCKGNS